MDERRRRQIVQGILYALRDIEDAKYPRNFIQLLAQAKAELAMFGVTHEEIQEVAYDLLSEAVAKAHVPV